MTAKLVIDTGHGELEVIIPSTIGSILGFCAMVGLSILAKRRGILERILNRCFRVRNARGGSVTHNPAYQNVSDGGDSPDTAPRGSNGNDGTSGPTQSPKPTSSTASGATSGPTPSPGPVATTSNAGPGATSVLTLGMDENDGPSVNSFVNKFNSEIGRSVMNRMSTGLEETDNAMSPEAIELSMFANDQNTRNMDDTIPQEEIFIGVTTPIDQSEIADESFNSIESDTILIKNASPVKQAKLPPPSPTNTRSRSRSTTRTPKLPPPPPPPSSGSARKGKCSKNGEAKKDKKNGKSKK